MTAVPEPAIRAVGVLNEALRADPVAMNAFMQLMVPVNPELAEHPTIQVGAPGLFDDVTTGPVMRPLGLINGLFGVDGKRLGLHLHGDQRQGRDREVLRRDHGGPGMTRYLSVQEAADELGCTGQNVRLLVKNGDLRAEHRPASDRATARVVLRIRRDELEEYRRRRQRPARVLLSPGGGGAARDERPGRVRDGPAVPPGLDQEERQRPRRAREPRRDARDRGLAVTRKGAPRPKHTSGRPTRKQAREALDAYQRRRRVLASQRNGARRYSD